MRPSGAGLGNMSGQECTLSRGKLSGGKLSGGKLSGGKLSGGKLSASRQKDNENGKRTMRMTKGQSE